MARQKEKENRAMFTELKQLRKKNARTNELLSDMMPGFVLGELLRDRLKVAYEYKERAILFADIGGFTSYAKDHS